MNPFVAAVEAFVGARQLAVETGTPWIDLEPGRFLADPDVQLPRLNGLCRTSEQGTPVG